MPGAHGQARQTAPDSSRIEALDVIRGVAVGGILLANVIVFFGLFLIPPERASQLPTAAIDPVAAFVGHVLVDGKFYSIFSLLFGIGLGLQLARGGEARFVRRSDTGLLRWTVGLLAVPTTLYAIGTGVWMVVGPADTVAVTGPRCRLGSSCASPPWEPAGRSMRSSAI